MANEKESSKTVKHIMYGGLFLALILVIAGIIIIIIGTQGFTEITFEGVKIVTNVVGIVLVVFGSHIFIKLLKIIEKIVEDGVVPDVITDSIKSLPELITKKI